MRSRQPLPRLWLMTDPRMGDGLWAALERLPRGSGVIFRHYGVPERRALFEQARRIAKRRRLVLVLAGSLREAAAWRADGAHGRSPRKRSPRPMLRTAPVHGVREMLAARADLLFLSPVFATRSHPTATGVGSIRFGLWVRRARGPVAALGGLDRQRFRGMAALGAYGWAAIDAWIRT